MEKPSKTVLIWINSLFAIACLVIPLWYGWSQGKDFDEFLYRLVFSFAGLIPSSLLALIIWGITPTEAPTEAPKLSEYFRLRSINDMEKLGYIDELGYYKSSFVIKLFLEKNILTFELSSLIIPVLGCRDVYCTALGLSNEQTQWRNEKDIKDEYWQLENEEPVPNPRHLNENRPRFLIKEPTIENYIYRCEINNSCIKIDDYHIFKYAVDSIRLEAYLPKEYQLSVRRDGLNSQKLTKVKQTWNSDRKYCVCCIQEIIPKGSELKWIITKET